MGCITSAHMPSENDASERSRRPEGKYANYFVVGYNANEFVMDFGQDHGEGDTLFHTRIITNPAYVQVFVHLLSASIEEWQKQYAAQSEERREH
jgi:hypothetical protein